MKQLTFIIEGSEEEPVDVSWPLDAADPLPGDLVDVEVERGRVIAGVVKWRKFERVVQGAYYVFRTYVCIEEIK